MRLLSSLLLMLAAWSLLVVGACWAPAWPGGAGILLSQLAVTVLVLSRQSWRQVPPPWAAPWGLAIGYALYPAVVRLVSHLGHDVFDLSYASPRAPGSGELSSWLGAVVLSPLFEESLYRGQLLPALRAAVGSRAAALLTSALFALSHLTPWSMLTTFLVGLALACLMLVTGDLWLCIALHAGLNLAFLVSGSPPQRYALCLPASLAAGVVGLWCLSRPGRISGA